MAHDLELEVSHFRMDIDEQSLEIHAIFVSNSLRVLHAVENGQALATPLRDKDKREIEANILKDVLQANKYPEIRFASLQVEQQNSNPNMAYKIHGTLEVCGVRKPLSFPVRRDGANLITEICLHQPDFAIKPYRAAFGALKIKPDVVVRVSLPWPANG